MLIVGADVLVAAGRRYPDARSALAAWVAVAQRSTWRSLIDVRKTYPSADGVPTDSGAVATVFNVRGNKYRLITRISYKAQSVQLVALLNHADYDKGKWKRI